MAPRNATSDAVIEPTETRAPSRVDRFSEYMSLRAKQDASDNRGVTMTSIMDRVLAADVDELWDSDEGGIPDGKDIAGIEQRILSVEVFQSKNPEIAKASLGDTYLIVHSARLDNGQEFDWNTSAELLVAKIMRFAMADKLPLDCVVVATDLGAGKAVLKLRPVPTRAI